MAGVTVTSARSFGLSRGIGKGPKLVAALLETSNGETLETGLQKIEGVSIGMYGAASDETVNVQSVSGGQLTLGAHKLSDYLTVVADINHYIMVVGTTEKATK